jgi:heat shock protein HslJ
MIAAKAPPVGAFVFLTGRGIIYQTGQAGQADFLQENQAMRQNHNLLLTAIAIFIAALVATGCSSSKSVQESKPDSTQPSSQLPRTDAGLLINTSWQAQSIMGKPASAAESTLTFGADNSVAGNAACNQYQTTADLSNGALQLGPIATTRMMCPPPVSGQETVFLEALELTRKWEWVGNTLELLDGENAVVTRLQQK